MVRQSKKLLRNKSVKRSKLNNVRLGKKVTQKRKPWKKRTMRGGIGEESIDDSIDDSLKKKIFDKFKEKKGKYVKEYKLTETRAKDKAKLKVSCLATKFSEEIYDQIIKFRFFYTENILKYSPDLKKELESILNEYEYPEITTEVIEKIISEEGTKEGDDYDEISKFLNLKQGDYAKYLFETLLNPLIEQRKLNFNPEQLGFNIVESTRTHKSMSLGLNTRFNLFNKTKDYFKNYTVSTKDNQFTIKTPTCKIYVYYLSYLYNILIKKKPMKDRGSIIGLNAFYNPINFFFKESVGNGPVAKIIIYANNEFKVVKFQSIDFDKNKKYLIELIKKKIEDCKTTQAQNNEPREELKAEELNEFDSVLIHELLDFSKKDPPIFYHNSKQKEIKGKIEDYGILFWTKKIKGSNKYNLHVSQKKGDDFYDVKLKFIDIDHPTYYLKLTIADGIKREIKVNKADLGEVLTKYIIEPHNKNKLITELGE